MRKFLFLSLLSLVFSLALKGQNLHLSGSVDISMSAGIITCDFMLENIPDIDGKVKILLNKGFNIKFIKDEGEQTLKYEGYYNGQMKGEGLVYVVSSAKTKRLHLSYVGAFPIYTDTLNFTDFKGLIAFNGKTLRATEQSKWYPVLYDEQTDQLLDQLTYHITVTCEAKSTIFVNGSRPNAGPKAIFESTVPVAPLLFAGSYGYKESANALFLNPSLNDQQMGIFDEQINQVKTYFSKVLGVAYATKNIFLEHQPIEKFNKGRSWGFASYPTIAFAGTPLSDMIDEKSRKLKDSTDYSFIAHEIAHYYFGNILRPNSTLNWFFLESTAEYLSLKASEAKFGKAFTSAYLKEKVASLKNFKATPLDSISDMNKINGTYRYLYGPLLIRGLEQHIGEKRTFAFLKACLNANDKKTDYSYFKEMATIAGVTSKEWSLFEQQFIQSENATRFIKLD